MKSTLAIDQPHEVIMNTYRIPTLKRTISIGDGKGSSWRVIGKEGFLVYGDPRKEKDEQYIREYGKYSIESDVMFIYDTDAQNALRLFFSHEGAKTGLNGQGSTRALRINDTIPIVELPGCQFLHDQFPRIASRLHDGLCSISAPTALSACPTQRALEVIDQIEKNDWKRFCIEMVSTGNRADDAYPFISSETLMDHPLFVEQVQQVEQYVSA